MRIVAVLFSLFAVITFMLTSCSEDKDNCEPCGSSCCADLENCISETCCNWSEIDVIPYSIIVNSIWGSSEEDVFAVGRDPLYNPGTDTGVIMHYDGTMWHRKLTSDDSDGNVIFWAVWGASPSNVFAVGSFGGDIPRESILKYNGSTWEEMHYIEEGYGRLLDVWGTSESNVYFVGHGNYQGTDQREAMVINYDGSDWSETRLGLDVELMAVWGSSESDIFAVGKERINESGESVGVILHYDGFDWNSRQISSIRYFSDVWGSSGTDVYAVGNRMIVHYDGSVWTEYNSGLRFVYSIWGSSQTNVFTVGDGDDQNEAILHFDGNVWKEMNQRDLNNLFSVWGSSDKSVIAAGIGIYQLKCSE